MARSKKQQVSLRVAERAVENLDRLAQQTGTTRNALAERYIAEGAQMDEFPQIYFRNGALGRRAALTGTRLDIWQVVETVQNHENSIPEAAEYLDVPAERIEAALRYYAANREDVDEFAQRARAAAERAEEIWRKQQELLTVEA